MLLAAAALSLSTAHVGAGATLAAEDGAVTFAEHPGKLQIDVGGHAFATYVFEDASIPRPYFAHVRVPGGPQVTRNHPPVAGKDAVDHDTFHPGIWLAFGDLNGADCWRNKARVRHAKFSLPSEAKGDGGHFGVVNHYLKDLEAGLVAVETCQYTIVARPSGTLLVCDSEFGSPAREEVVFGDQEEMGLGLRVATPLAVTGGGTIVTSDGLRNEEQAWGKQAAWCDYSGVMEGRRIGMTLMPDPKNFRPSWYHARNYGFVAANPFGRQAFAKGEKSRVVIKRGETLRLRFGVLVHSAPADEPIDLAAAYQDFLSVLEK